MYNLIAVLHAAALGTATDGKRTRPRIILKML